MPDLKPTDADFRALADTAPILCWMADAAGWIFWYNSRWHDYCGTTPAEMEGWGWQRVHDPQELPAVMERWRASIATGERFEMVFPLRGRDGVYRPFLTRVQPLRDDAGKIVRWFGVNIDISELRESEKKQQMLLRELNHRVKNLFAIAIAMVTMTARRAKSVPAMAQSLTSRLSALGSAHELIRPALVADNGPVATSLHELIGVILAPYRPEGRKVLVEGPAIILGPTAITSLAMLLHELATNAAKYGSLSAPEGQLAITWETSGETLALCWSESGGPAPSGPPDHKGFGSALIRLSFEQLNGKSEYRWENSGLAITSTIPLERLRH